MNPNHQRRPMKKQHDSVSELVEALKIALHYMEGDSDDKQEQLDYAFIIEAIDNATK